MSEYEFKIVPPEPPFPSPRNRKRKPWVLVVCLILLVAVGVGGTLAYFQMASNPVINTFQAGSVGAQINETVNGNTKTMISVTNTGASPVYARIRLVSYFEASQGVLDASKASPSVSFTLGDGWVQLGSYYYYTTPLAAGATTTDLLGSDVSMAAGQVIEVLADTVQATPAQAVVDTWGVDASQFITQ